MANSFLGGAIPPNYADFLQEKETEERLVLDRKKAWLMQRVGKFTASNIHKLMTYEDKLDTLPKGAKTYAEEVALEILTNGQSREEFRNEAMERGNEKELEAVARFETITGLECYATGENQEFIQHGDYFGGTPDGLFGDDGLIEVKCPKSKTHFFNIKNLKNSEDLKKHYPEYYWQIQGNFLATGRNKGYFISYDDRFTDENLQILILEISRNDEDIEKLTTRLLMANGYKKEFLQWS